MKKERVRMMQSSGKIAFTDRSDAGRKLAKSLSEYQNEQVVVLGIPNGGLPIAIEIANALNANLDVIISRKIPIPLRPEGGFGALTDDGTVILNDDLVKHLNLTNEQINFQIRKITANIRRRTLLYRGNRQLTIISNKTVIITDDGLASGYTMLAAVNSVRKRRAKEIIVAVPVASQTAINKVSLVADRVISPIISDSNRFYLEDYYQYWHDLNDNQAISSFRQWQIRQSQPLIPEPRQHKRNIPQG